jgi:hypothetical protein
VNADSPSVPTATKTFGIITDDIPLEDGGTEKDFNSRRRIACDYITDNCGGSALNGDSSSRLWGLRAAILQSKSFEDRSGTLSGCERGNRVILVPINDRDFRPLLAPNRNGLAEKIDIFDIGSPRHEDRVAIIGPIDGLLNRWDIARHANRSGPDWKRDYVEYR